MLNQGGVFMSNDFQEIIDYIEKEKKNSAFIFQPGPILPEKDSLLMPIVETVFLDPTNDIYNAQGKFRIRYTGLLKLSLAASMRWSINDTRRTDNRNDKLYCSFMAVGGVLKSDNTVNWVKAEKDMDLEVMEMELEDQYNSTWDKDRGNGKIPTWKTKDYTERSIYVDKMVRRDMISHRKNKLTKSESGAKARVIRAILGLQGTYSNENQLKGMAFIMVHFASNPNHPDNRANLINSVNNAQNMIYGSGRRQEQLSYFDSSVGDSDIIDASCDEIEGEKPDESNDGYSGKVPKPALKIKKPKPEEDDEISLDIFKDSDVKSQIKILEGLCKDTGDDLEAYKKHDRDNQTWRNGFFEHLLKEKENKKS